MTQTLREPGRLSGLRSFRGRHRVLHLTWFAFFLTFVVWFNLAPFAKTIGAQLGLSAEQLTVLALCNVALTVPARLLVGMLLDHFGPRRVYAGLLMFAVVPCTVFALASSFPLLVASRLLLSVVGAGFVIGIRMVAEWFPPKEIGLAEGVYGGWGNFGSAAAALTLPTVAAIVGGPNGWRLAIGVTGVMAAVYGTVYMFAVQDTPDGSTYHRPRRPGALEVTSRPAVAGLIAVLLPLVGVLGLLGWRLQRVGFMSGGALAVLLVALAAIYAFQVRTARRVNRPALRDAYPPSDRYAFRSVPILCFAYLVNFGSELAVVSMLPAFFSTTWGLGTAAAAATASAFAFVNLFARPAGGLLSDLLGSRRRTLIALMAGLSVGYVGLSALGPRWPVAGGVAVAMFCSLFVQSSEGAVFAVVPLVKRRVTGQIAGLVGAYGNVGALLFLTVLLLWGPKVFFLTIAAASIASVVSLLWLPEPDGSFAEEHADDGVAHLELHDDEDLELVS